MPPVIDVTKCNGCGICDFHCPLDVIHIGEGQRFPMVKYADECWHCGSCRLDCPTQAITIRFGPEMLCL